MGWEDVTKDQINPGIKNPISKEKSRIVVTTTTVVTTTETQDDDDEQKTDQKELLLG